MKEDIELIMLGTGYAMAVNCYNTCFVLKNGTECWLVDAGGGNGIMKQLDRAGVSYPSIRHLFVTHGHTDHVLGVVWVTRRIAMVMNEGQYIGNFTIYCHEELSRLILLLCQQTLPAKLSGLIGERIRFYVIADGDQADIIGLKVRFFDITSVKMKQFGFRAVLPDKTVVVCLGDEPYHETCRPYVVPCDWLLAEAFCLYRDKDIFKPYNKQHSTAKDAAKVAEKLKVKNLVLYHTEDTELTSRKENYSREAESVFSGRIFVPDDLDRMIL